MFKKRAFILVLSLIQALSVSALAHADVDLDSYLGNYLFSMKNSEVNIKKREGAWVAADSIYIAPVGKTFKRFAFLPTQNRHMPTLTLYVSPENEVYSFDADTGGLTTEKEFSDSGFTDILFVPGQSWVKATQDGERLKLIFDPKDVFGRMSISVSFLKSKVEIVRYKSGILHKKEVQVYDRVD